MRNSRSTTSSFSLTTGLMWIVSMTASYFILQLKSYSIIGLRARTSSVPYIGEVGSRIGNPVPSGGGA